MLVYLLQQYSDNSYDGLESFMNTQERKSFMREFEDDNELIRNECTNHDELFNLEFQEKHKVIISREDIYDITQFIFKQNEKFARSLFCDTNILDISLKNDEMKMMINVTKEIVK